MITDRQKKILIKIVDIFVRNGEPVSSGQVFEDGSITISSALIRMEMVELEKNKYIFKSNANSLRTSGRIPTKKAYELYLNNIKENPSSFLSIKNELDKILNDRKKSIDEILNDSIKLINSITNTLIISTDIVKNSKLKELKTYKINDKKAIIIAISSEGYVNNKEFKIEGFKYEDFEGIVEKFNSMIIDTPISSLNDNLNLLKEIISMNVHNAEDDFQEIIKNIFSKLKYSNEKYIGMNSLITSRTINSEDQIKKLFKVIENNSIWEIMKKTNLNSIESHNLTVDLDSVEGMSIVNKEIDLGDKNKKLTIIGSKIQNYEKLFSILKYIEDAIKKEGGW